MNLSPYYNIICKFRRKSLQKKANKRLQEKKNKKPPFLQPEVRCPPLLSFFQREAGPVLFCEDVAVLHLETVKSKFVLILYMLKDCVAYV